MITTCSRNALPQVWNANPVVGVVGVFNLQGASWDRIRRKFLVHTRNPPTLSTTVAARDVETLRALASDRGEQQPGEQQPLEFACYHYATQELRLMPDAAASVPVTLAPSGSDMIWFSPIVSRGGVKLAPLGLADMYNGGGAVTSLELSSGRGKAADGASGSGPELVASIGVRGCGKLLLYSSVRPKRVWVNMAPRDFTYEPYGARLEVEVPQSSEDMAAEVEVMY